MKRITIGLLCTAMLCGFMFTGCAAASSGEKQEQGEPRIICTSAPLCTVLDQLDLDLVGVPNTAFTLPERYKEVEKVGPPMTPDLEIVKSLNPTDIISPNSLQYDLKPQYESIQVPSTFVNLMSLDGMFKSIEQLGEKYDKKEQAEALIREYESFIEDYSNSLQGKERPRVLILMGLPGSYMVATEKSYVGSLVKLAGAENVFGGDEAFLNINTEEMSKRDPDIILRTSHAMPEMVMEMFRKEFSESDIWKHFRAVQENQVYDLSNEKYGMSANLNYQPALNELKTLLYGEEAQ